MLLFPYQNQTGVDILNSSHIEDLGSLVAGLDRKTLRKIAKDAFIDNLYNIARAKGYDVKKLEEIAKLAKQHFDKRLVCKIICCTLRIQQGPLSWSNWNLEMLFLWREENRRTRRKTLGARREPTTNSSHI